MEKEILLKLASDVRDGWEAVIEELGTARLEIAGACGDWRVRDVLAHCNGYDRWQMVQIRSAFTGETPTDKELQGGIDYPPNDDLHEDAMNAMFIAGTRDLPTEEILRHWREVTTIREEWLSAATQQQLDMVIGADWASGAQRVMRLVSEVPAASNPQPVWKPIFDQIDHQEIHLDEVREWMGQSK